MTSLDDDLRSLITRHKQNAVQDALREAGLDAYGQPVEDVVLADFMIPDAPDAVAGIVEQLALIKVQRDALEKEEKRYADALKAMAGGSKGISDGRRKLLTVSTSTTTRVNSAWVKENIDPADHPDAYTTTPSTTLRIDPAFKAEVLAKQTAILEA